MKITATKVVLELELPEASSLKKLLGALSLEKYRQLMTDDEDGIERVRKLYVELDELFIGVL